MRPTRSATRGPAAAPTATCRGGHRADLLGRAERRPDAPPRTAHARLRVRGACVDRAPGETHRALDRWLFAPRPPAASMMRLMSRPARRPPRDGTPPRPRRRSPWPCSDRCGSSADGADALGGGVVTIQVVGTLGAIAAISGGASGHLRSWRRRACWSWRAAGLPRKVHHNDLVLSWWRASWPRHRWGLRCSTQRRSPAWAGPCARAAGGHGAVLPDGVPEGGCERPGVGAQRQHAQRDVRRAAGGPRAHRAVSLFIVTVRRSPTRRAGHERHRAGRRGRALATPSRPAYVVAVAVLHAGVYLTARPRLLDVGGTARGPS